ncbi:NAD(P)-dependent oxidoreductase [Nisaea sediminum]|uniref:NAD(P)-dependent oxidoreductase n=1 Tax=Nisaea sediminum TaxID=2775867 RepID=UPI00186797E7|nr:NAD(P)-dependent oxidoreductase [Nisaea sediminum]
MPRSVAIYEKTIERLAPRLESLDLDITLIPFTAAGEYRIGGKTVPPEEADIDYLWLSPDLSFDKLVEPALKMALRTRSIGVMQTFNAGLDNPLYKQIGQRGVRLCNSDAQAIAISEYVMANVLAAFHPLERRRELQEAKTWEKTPFREISGTNWLIFGYGPIGRNIARRARAFDAKISVIRRSPGAIEGIDRVGTLSDIDAFLPDADVIVLACALNDETRGMAGTRFFEAAREGSLLVNIGRGGLVVDAALIAALDSGRLSRAVLDVFHQEPLPASDPLWAHPKITLTAHTSFNGSGVRARWDELFFDNLPRFLRGDALKNEVSPDTL